MKTNLFYSKLPLLLWAISANVPNAFGQEKIPQVVIYGDVKNHVTDAVMPGVTVQLISDGKIIETGTSSASGKFKFKTVGIFQNYQVVFSGKNLVSRFVDFELKNIPTDKTYEKWDFELPMKMVEKNKFVDLTVLESKRSSVIKFSSSSGELEFNTTEIANYRKELDRLLKEAHQNEIKAKNEAQLARENEKNNKRKYDSLMLVGKNELSTGNFNNAIMAYTKALDVSPKDESAASQLKRAETLKEEAAIRNRNMYISILQTADKLFGEANYAGAKEYYQRATTNFKYNEPYPIQQISACEMKLKEIAGVDSSASIEEPLMTQTIVKNTNATIPVVPNDDSYQKARRFITLADNNQQFYADKNNRYANNAYTTKRQIDENTAAMRMANRNQDKMRLQKINEIESAKSLRTNSRNTNAVVDTTAVNATYTPCPTGVTNKAVMLDCGIHEWKTQRVNSKNEPVELITERLVVGANRVDRYVMTKSKWGVSFTKNGQTIGEHTWNIETGFAAVIVHEK